MNILDITIECSVANHISKKDIVLDDILLILFRAFFYGRKNEVWNFTDCANEQTNDQ